MEQLVRTPGESKTHRMPIESGGDTREIDDVQILDVINDPLRSRIWSQLRVPRSVKELAAAVGMAPGRLYYHLDLLERSGWIEVVDERRVKTRTERIYRSAFSSYRVSERLQHSGAVSDAGMLTGLLDEITADFAGAWATTRSEADQRPDAMMRRFGKLSPEAAAELRARADALLAEYFSGDVVGDGAGDVYGSVFLLAPFEEPPSHGL